MANSSDTQSLTSRIIKILRITNEPLSAHAINELYGLPYKKVQKILKQLEEDNLVHCLKTKRGTFYFIPDKYFKRDKDLLDSEEVLPYLWYEELSAEELKIRKQKIVYSLDELKSKFESKELSATEFFTNFQKKNEELSIITQIIEDRKEKQRKYCYYCEAEFEGDLTKCPNCNKDLPKCSVCKRLILAKQSVVLCPKCKEPAHETHLKEWVKSIGNCPSCKQQILESNLVTK
jgi:DNA-binding transcriptional regulator GbsR (MarR family)